MVKRAGKRTVRKRLIVPPYTGSLDAKVPAEKVILAHYIETSEKWFAASQSSDGHVFYGLANTEPLARRAAGLRTLHHLELRASGEIKELTSDEIAKAKTELADELSQIIVLYQVPLRLTH